MTSVSEHYHRETLQCRNETTPFNHTNDSSVCLCVTFAKVIDNQNNEVSNGYQRHHTGVFQRVETSQEGQRHHNQHERRYPETAVYEKCNVVSSFVKASHNAWHQVPNDDQVTDSHAETLYSNRCIEYDGCIRVCDLR